MANDLNRCFFIGRLGKDPETKALGTGTTLANFSIAVGSAWKDKQGQKQESTEWVRCTAFGKLADIIGQYLTKGSQVLIIGKWKTRQWEKDSVTQYMTECIVDEMQMLGSKTKPAASKSAFDQRPPVDDDSSDIPF